MQIFLTEAFTFMGDTLNATDYTSTTTIGIELQRDFVADQDLDPMKPHFASQIRKCHFSLFRFYSEQGVGERFFNHSLNELRLLHNVRRNNNRLIGSGQCYDALGSTVLILMSAGSPGNALLQKGSMRACASSTPANPSMMV